MRIFGLIGYPLGHSFSQKFFTEKFLKENLEDTKYENFPLPAIGELPNLLASQPALQGFNVTIPYKEQIIPYLDYQNEVVVKTGACNCVNIRDGKLYGYNTDVIGFEKSLAQKSLANHTHALILGKGGAAKAVEYVFIKRGIEYKFVIRKPVQSSNEINYEQLDHSLLRTYTLIINTTPIGMFPRTGECPNLPYEAIGSSHYLFDLVYNPAKTLFLQRGEAKGATVMNGYEMLVIQAEESWKIWNDI